jgi:hypothetical protein
MKNKTQFLLFTFTFLLCILRAFCAFLWLKLNLPRRSLLAKTGQSKHVNYAKQTQFSKKSNVYNRNFNNELQRKMDNGHLVKTNPIKANLW